MQKELTIFFICMLALLADVLCFRQLFFVQLTRFVDYLPAAFLVVFTVCLLALSLGLLRKIIDELTAD